MDEEKKVCETCNNEECSCASSEATEAPAQAEATAEVTEAPVEGGEAAPQE